MDPIHLCMILSLHTYLYIYIWTPPIYLELFSVGLPVKSYVLTLSEICVPH